MNKISKKAFSLVEVSIVILIIGILIAAISKGSKIYKEVKFAGAQSVTKSSTITTIEGLVAWWELTSDESLKKNEKESDNLKISTWQDINPRVTNKSFLTQNNINYQPTYSPYAINNLPALKFNGSNYLEIPYKADFNSPEFSIFLVVKPERVSSFSGILSSRDDYPQRGITVYLSPNSTYYVQQGTGAGWSGYSGADIAATPNKMEILSFVRTTSKLTSYSKGKLVGSINGALSLNKESPLRIGAGASEIAAKYFYFGYIGEIIIFDRALKDNQRSAVEKYLIQKWI